MIRAASFKLRSKRLISVLFFLLVVLLLAFRQSFRRRDVRGLPHIHPHKGFLVTTPNDDRHPLRYLPVRSITNVSVELGLAVPVSTGISPNSKQGVSHIVQHAESDALVYITNEIRPGSIWTGRLQKVSDNLELGIFGQNPSNGDLPAHSIVTRDGKFLIVANYGSPTISVHLIGSEGRILHLQTVTLPWPVGVSEDILPHPHHIAQHPSGAIFYVANLGWNVIHVLRASKTGRSSSIALDVVQNFDVSSLGSGPRNGVLSSDGRTYFLSFQTSSSVIAIPLDRRQRLQTPSTPSVRSLPRELLEEGISTPNNEPIHISSDIHLFGSLLLVANRRVKGPYPPLAGESGDTIAVFDTADGQIAPKGHISTGCWKPREMMRVRGESTDYLAITCNGQSAEGGGVVIVDLSEPYRVAARWDSGELSVFGIVGLSTDFGDGRRRPDA